MPGKPSDRLHRIYLRYRESENVLGIAMAAIAMLFIAGIVTAFIHAADVTHEQQARNHASAPSETTGSGGLER